MKWHSDVALLPQEFLEVAKILVALWGKWRREMTTFVAGRGLKCSVMIAVTRRGDPCNHRGHLSVHPFNRPSIPPTVSLSTWRYHLLYISFLQTLNFQLNCDQILSICVHHHFYAVNRNARGGKCLHLEKCCKYGKKLATAEARSDFHCQTQPHITKTNATFLCFFWAHFILQN